MYSHDLLENNSIPFIYCHTFIGESSLGVILCFPLLNSKGFVVNCLAGERDIFENIGIVFIPDL